MARSFASTGLGVCPACLPASRVWSAIDQSSDPLPPALNTLDLLKKGSTPLAQRARNASRVLEEQVGTNPRVRVQHDTAFVLWDQISFDEDSNSPSTPNAVAVPPSPSPEWVRRTICCAQWETEHADEAHPRVVLATLAKQQQQQQQQQQSPAATSGDASQDTEPTPSFPAWLPVPPHAQNRFEMRATGTLVAYWARRARLAVLEVAPSSGPDGRISPEDRRPAHHHHRGRGEHHHPAKGNGGGMVERPPAVKAMMDVMSQPSRVVRVLARGEKLDP